MALCVSRKFHHASEQYRLDARGFTLLRLSYGATGGALKTATARDNFGPRVFPEHFELAKAMAMAWQKLGLRTEYLKLRVDSKRRPFVEAAGAGSREEFLCAMQSLGEEMASTLGLGRPRLR